MLFRLMAFPQVTDQANRCDEQNIVTGACLSSSHQRLSPSDSRSSTTLKQLQQRDQIKYPFGMKLSPSANANKADGANNVNMKAQKETPKALTSKEHRNGPKCTSQAIDPGSNSIIQNSEGILRKTERWRASSLQNPQMSARPQPASPLEA